MSDDDSEAVISRSYSEKYLQGAGDIDLVTNVAQNWSNTASFKLAYIFAVVMCWFFFHLTQVMSPSDCWTATNFCHFLVIFNDHTCFVLLVPYFAYVFSVSFYCLFCSPDHFRAVSLGERLPGRVLAG